MPLIMGIINVTPDSFSDGGLFDQKDKALSHARELAGQGAHILDIGGESTRPGAKIVTMEEEIARVLPAIGAITAAELGTAISIDTYKAKVAESALKAGAHIVNDVWGLQREPDIAKAASAHGAPVIINHWEETAPKGLDLLDAMKAFFDRSIEIALKAGLKDQHIILDPGIGFGKNFEDNLVILNRLEEICAWGYPVLMGTSRKSFIGKILDKEPQDRLYGTIASNVISQVKGAAIFRVHDVEAHMDALRVTQAIETKAPHL
ncbi:MAG: dihydropteroate synthase [Cohaesibacter sp.]|jgi:dihydropteroate synthase|nr:dihydropteroate synthase [Cohaesibacter sp.]